MGLHLGVTVYWGVKETPTPKTKGQETLTEWDRQQPTTYTIFIVTRPGSEPTPGTTK